MKWVVIALSLLMGGCTAAALGAAESKVKEAVEAKRQVSDIEGEAVKSAPCLMTVGAYFRLNDDREQAAIAVLCGGDRGDPFIDVGPVSGGPVE